MVSTKNPFFDNMSNFCQKAQENIFKCTLFYSLLSPKMHKKVWQRNLQISLSATHFRCILRMSSLIACHSCVCVSSLSAIETSLAKCTFLRLSIRKFSRWQKKIAAVCQQHILRRTTRFFMSNTTTFVPL